MSARKHKAWITDKDRAAVLHSGAVCSVCGTDGTEHDPKGRPNPLTVDHVIPESKGGPNHISNYRAMCRFHNEQRGNKTDAERVTWFNPKYFPEVAA